MTTRRHFITSVTAALGGSVFAASGKPKTVLLQSAWDTINIGDIGHTPGTLRILEEHLPEVKVMLWAMKLDDRVEAMLRRRFPKVEIIQGKLNGTKAADKVLHQAISDCDLFIRNSGMGQGTDFIEYCRKLGKPYGLYGQSFFPTMVEGKGAAERIDLLGNAAFIYCRETKTLDILKGAGVKTPVLEFGPDGCFGIDVRDDERGLATMKKLGLEERKFITLQLRTQTAKHEGEDNPPLNPFHSPKCWMFKDIGLGDWLLEFDSTPAEKMADTLFAIDADYPAALAKVKTAMDFVHQRQAETMKVAGKILGEV